eukprot:4568719-Prymnesium_polylepis.1
MMLPRAPVSLAREWQMTEFGHPFPIWQLRPPHLPPPPLSGPHAHFATPHAHQTRRGGRCAAGRSLSA